MVDRVRNVQHNARQSIPIVRRNAVLYVHRPSAHGNAARILGVRHHVASSNVNSPLVNTVQLYDWHHQS